MNNDVALWLSSAPITFVTTMADADPSMPRGRQVVVAGPPAVMDLLAAPDVTLLAALVANLHEPATAWPAEVVLAALTGRDADIVDAFARSPNEWLATLRESAEQAWRAWLTAHRASLVWSPAKRRFTLHNQ
jgi:hypothetical protein